MRITLLLLITILFCNSCKEKQKSADEAAVVTSENNITEDEKTEGTYFSITHYFVDQWNTRRGNPYTLLRVLKNEGSTDSSFVPLDSTLWFGLRAHFDEADISDSSYLGKYDFDMFDDETTETTHILYEAKEPQLLMRKMDIGVDISSNLVRSVYMETRRESRGNTITKKLQYIPDRIFQIQELESNDGKTLRNTVSEYLFTY
jgi:hypothetical protein